MGKKIVICLDGTGNEVKGSRNTNVVELYDLLDLSDPTKQVAYYDPGVGTFSAPGAWTPPARFVSRVAGLAFGVGLRQNLVEAYTYLMRVYEPGDEVYVFGFSRGAFTARALTGLVHLVGVFRPGAENLVPYVVATYVRKKADWDRLREFRWVFARRDGNGETVVPVFELLGLWDTVKAAGLLRWDEKWPYAHAITGVRKVRHAVSIDEYRRPYRAYLAVPHEKADPRPEIYEVWFAGVHSDVGGTLEENGLSRIPLKWMAQGAKANGVLMKRAPYFGMCASVGPANALATVHRMGRAWRLARYRKRVVPPGANVHDSVRDRIASGTPYAATLPPDVRWCDEGWAG
jgi:uncharacterized protein (DUF2235 family)